MNSHSAAARQTAMGFAPGAARTGHATMAMPTNFQRLTPVD